ncbi:MAG: 6-bladed beta-propeller [Gemmatimonadales bacterium]
MRQPRSLYALSSIVLLAAAPLAAQIPARWAVTTRPITNIGVDDGTPEQELANVTGALRLPDGRVVVANGKPRELRVYAASGRFVRRIGRLGDGPGEFRGRTDFLPAGGDSIMIYDQISTRVELFNGAGALLRQWPPAPGGAPRGQMIATNATIGQDIPERFTHCFRTLATALPRLAPSELREILTDGSGRFWSHPYGQPSWTVYAADGKPIGSVALPPRFKVYAIGSDYVLGKLLDEDDVEHVEVLRVTAPRLTPVHAACVTVRDSFPAVTGERVDALKKGLRSAMTAGEMAYSNYATYVASLDSLPQLADRLPDATTFTVLAGDRFGWGAVLFDRRSPLVCAFGVASGVPHGWTDGDIRCMQ